MITSGQIQQHAGTIANKKVTWPPGHQCSESSPSQYEKIQKTKVS